MTPDKNKDIEELKVAAVGGIYFKAAARCKLQVSSPLLKGHDDKSSLWRGHIFSACNFLSAVAFTLYSECEMTAKAEEETRMPDLELEYFFAHDLIDY